MKNHTTKTTSLSCQQRMPTRSNHWCAAPRKRCCNKLSSAKSRSFQHAVIINAALAGSSFAGIVTALHRRGHGLYGAVGVPEVWRYDGTRMQFLVRQGAVYRASTHSRSFPHLTSERLSYYLTTGRERGARAMLQEVKADL